RVEILGSVGREQLAELMRSSTMLLLTSWSETFGLVALEAQASGTPTVAWRCAGGVQEAIAPGGLALDSRAPDVWAEAVPSLRGDAGRYAEAVASARDCATDRTWTASASALATQYARLLDETPDVKEIPCRATRGTCSRRRVSCSPSTPTLMTSPCPPAPCWPPWSPPALGWSW